MIAYIDPHVVPDSKPAALQLLQTVEALADIGEEVVLVTAPSTVSAREVLGREGRGAFTHVTVPSWMRGAPMLRRSSWLFNRWALRWLERQEGVRAVYVRNLKLAYALVRAGCRLPVFFEAHEIFVRTYADEHQHLRPKDRKKLAELELRERTVYGGVAGVVALTGHLLDDIRADYGYRGPGVVAPDGVDTAWFQLPGIGGEPNHIPVLLYLGSLHVWKGVETAIRAIVHVPGALLRIAGGTEARIAELKAVAVALGVRERVEFLGHVPPAQRHAVIAQADICLLPLANYTIAERHTSPLKLFEYLALGKPVVASDLPSIREVVEDGKSALLFPAGVAEAMAQAVNGLLASPELRERLSQAARSVAADYTWAARAGRIAAFIRQVAGGRDDR